MLHNLIDLKALNASGFKCHIENVPDALFIECTQSDILALKAGWASAGVYTQVILVAWGSWQVIHVSPWVATE